MDKTSGKPSGKPSVMRVRDAIDNLHVLVSEALEVEGSICDICDVEPFEKGNALSHVTALDGIHDELERLNVRVKKVVDVLHQIEDRL